MGNAKTRKVVLCDLYCTLSKSIENLSQRPTAKFSGASGVTVLKKIQDEVERALEASE